MNYIDQNIVSVELSTIKRGLHKVFVNWNTKEQSSITFSTKKEAKYYYDYVTGNPNHPIHKNNREFGFIEVACLHPKNISK